VLSARALAPDLVIVARARTADSKEKLVLAGATRAVNPQMIGGRRLAAFALQPDVAEFLDVVVHDEEFDFRIQQVRVSPESSLVGQKLDDLDIPGATGVQVLALRKSGTKSFTFNPHGDSAVSPHCVLIGFGTLEGIEALQLLARG
jgi:voltage-gated potassium channel